MKKLLVILTIIVLTMIIVVGCATEDETPPEDDNGIIDDNDTVPGDEPPMDEDNNDIDTDGDESAWQDGTYDAQSDPDERGWMSQIQITVENGSISEVDFDEVNKEGASKTEDEEYGQNMEAETGVTPSEAHEQLEQQLIDTQNIDEVDVVTGATSTTEQFKELAEEALATQ